MTVKYTVKQAHAILVEEGITSWTEEMVRRWIRKGKLKATKGRIEGTYAAAYLINEVDLLEFIKNKKES